MKILTVFRCAALVGGLVFGNMASAGETVWHVIGAVMQPRPPFDENDVALIDADIVRKGDQIGYWMQVVNHEKLMAELADKESRATKNFYKQLERLQTTKYLPPLFDEVKADVTLDADTGSKLLALYLLQEVAANTLRYELRIKTYSEVNCADRSIRVTAVYVLDKSIPVYGSSSFPAAAFSPIPPNSLADKARRWFCK